MGGGLFLRPHDGTIAVYDEDGWVGIAGGLIVDPVGSCYVRIYVVQNGERVSLRPCRQVCTREIVNADGKYLCVQIDDLVVFPSQLPELLNTIGSPESPVKHQYNVPLTAE